MNRHALLLPAALLIAAGCTSPPGPVASPPAAATTWAGDIEGPRLEVPSFDFSHVISPDHGGIPGGHGLQNLHTGHFGLDLVAYNPMTRAGEGPLTQDVAYTGIDVWGTWACSTQWPGPGGFMLVDIKDPAHPRIVSTQDSGGANQMCRITDDGDYLFLGNYIGANNQPNGNVPPPAGDAAGVGVRVYDIKDKAHPRFLFHDTQGAADQSTHGIYTAKIGNVNYLAYSYTGQLWALDPGAAQLRLVATVPMSGHDTWIGHHPVTGAWTLVEAKGCNLVVYDISDPANPVELDEWVAKDETAFVKPCADHWRRPLDKTVGGRAYMVVVGAEDGGASLHFNILDWTDPTHVYQVSQWVLPGEPESPEPNFYTFGGTEYETWNGYVALGLMHAGVWVFDIGTPERALHPATIGYFEAPQVPQLNGGTTNKPFPFTPLHWTAAFDERGYIVSPDTSSGLYVLKFGATRTDG